MIKKSKTSNAKGKHWKIKDTSKMKGRIPWNKGLKTGIAPWLGKKRLHMTGEKHFAWKGDGVGMVSLHDWVRSRLGTPSKCEHCGKTEAKKFEWANKSHEYKRDLTDWVRLCVPCHRKYDGHSKKMWITRKTIYPNNPKFIKDETYKQIYSKLN